MSDALSQTPEDKKEVKAGAPSRHVTSENLKDIIIHDISDPITRALAALLYLSGSRISEIVGRTKGEYLYEYPRGSGNRIKVDRDLRGFLPGQISQRKIGEITFYSLEGLPVLKRRKDRIYRTVTVGPKDADVMQIVLDYCKNKDPKEPMFDFGRKQAWSRIRKAFGRDNPGRLDRPLWNHYFRHAHCTHRVREESYDALLLAKEMGWKNVNHALTYVGQDNRDIEIKLIQNYRRQKEGL